ncbi:GyrI-like domain-containing protein [Microbacterium sp. CIAB417]|uniref:GyrI-like domain-containing protein n=1 Tax=Microbacterium sp. CIAB417 TaxID=2860287 RepID=UPI001FAC5E38|nr:GyrI-like domain-containing protein [Microbacterium sp. CIAB417]
MTAFPEAPFGAADRIELDPMPLAVVRHVGIRFDDLREAFDAGYAAVGRQFGTGALVPAGPALAIYHGNPMEEFDLELGFPVASAPADPIDADGVLITASTLPSGPAVATTYLGAYDGLGTGWSGLVERAVSAGLMPRGISIEVYVSDPTERAERLRTDLILPLT